MSKKRYTMAQQIIDDIDKCHERASLLAKEAEALDLEADELFKEPYSVEQAKLKRLLASRVRLRANNLRNKRAKKLGDKLAEFRTAAMSILPDNSTPA